MAPARRRSLRGDRVDPAASDRVIYCLEPRVDLSAALVDDENRLGDRRREDVGYVWELVEQAVV
jgi:hypothetical protein